jgi:hypothetical protein
LEKCTKKERLSDGDIDTMNDRERERKRNREINTQLDIDRVKAREQE